MLPGSFARHSCIGDLVVASMKMPIERMKSEKSWRPARRATDDSTVSLVNQ